ncbi:putative laccase 3 peptidase [Mycena indigotica]|uniref:Putative laccase 3 peptidase n=1 Tax=Mycena indigotica TaxID=2126181 RepID=A0A8H6SMU8_9AGAR|nr:putative laccase 3 peptidase [Mycena indigotica]KAF7302224.1 putative laccase 3 peptidase [Mycena indigotica]
MVFLRTWAVFLSGLSLLAISAFAGDVRTTTLRIANKNISVDGFPRSAVLANGKFPGTAISINKGDRMVVNVINELTDPTMFRSTSIHWHGLFMKGSSYDDGAAFVTQCPIIPNNSFTYDFIPTYCLIPQVLHPTDHFAGRHFLVPLPSLYATMRWPTCTADQFVSSSMILMIHTGYFFFQYSDSSIDSCLLLAGIREPLSMMLEFDLERLSTNRMSMIVVTTIIALADWFHQPTRGTAFPLYTTNLINGKGRFTGGPAAELAVINVQKGLRYRFRLISMSCGPNFVFSIDEHSMTIIEADGVLTQPLIVDSIQIYTGQRYSFILDANQPEVNYWVRSLPNIGDTTFDNGVNSAVLHYSRADSSEPKTKQTPSIRPLNEADLRPLVPTVVPGRPFVGGADVNINLNIGLDFNTLRFSLNGVSFTPPTAPALLQILSGAHLASDLLPAGSYFALPPNKVIEVSIPGGADPAGPHPFHLHGHNFFVVRSTNMSDYNFIDPIVRDVVNTGFPGDNVTFRFVTDNAGPWFLHCHIDLHMDIGLAVVFAEDIPTISKQDTPAAWKNLCPAYNALNPSQL